MLRTAQLAGTDDMYLLERDGQRRPSSPDSLTLSQELAAGDTVLLRAKGSRPSRPGGNDGSALVAARLRRRHDSTYGAAGYAGVGLRGTTGRLEDFGARALGGTARDRPECSAVAAGDRRQRPGLPRAGATPSSNGGSAITGYRVYRGTAPNPTVALIPDLGLVTSFTRQRAHERADLLLQGHRPERDRRERGLERGESRRRAAPRHRPRRSAVPAGDRRQRPASRSPGRRPPRTAARPSPATASTAEPPPTRPSPSSPISAWSRASLDSGAHERARPTTTRSPP